MVARLGGRSETPAELPAQCGSGSTVEGGRAGKGGSKPGAGGWGPHHPGKHRDWPEGTVMGWCPNCGAGAGRGRGTGSKERQAQAAKK